MLAVIREAGVVDRVMIQSFDWRTLQLFQAAEPRLRTVYLTVGNRELQQRGRPGVDGGPAAARLSVGAGT